MNNLFSMLGSMSGAGASSGGVSGMSVLMQAVGAAMRGEDPHAFMKRLANQHPQLKKMNLNDLQGTAQQLCKQNGVNADEVAKNIDGVIDPLIHK